MTTEKQMRERFGMPSASDKNAHEDWLAFRGELRSILADCSEFLSTNKLAGRQALADRCEAMLSQIVAEDCELEQDRRDLAALLKAAHEWDDHLEDFDLSEEGRTKLDALQAATLPYQDRIDLFTGETIDLHGCTSQEQAVAIRDRLKRTEHVDIEREWRIERERFGGHELSIRGNGWSEIEERFAHARLMLTGRKLPETVEALEEDISEVISDSFDVDWTSETGARAVVDYLTARNAPIATPGTVTAPAILHRLSVMAYVAERDKRLGDVQPLRDAMGLIGSLQSQVTRLTGTWADGVHPNPDKDITVLPLDGQ